MSEDESADCSGESYNCLNTGRAYFLSFLTARKSEAKQEGVYVIRQGFNNFGFY